MFDLINPVELVKQAIKWCKRPKLCIKFEYLLATGSGENKYCHLRHNTTYSKESWFFRIGINNTGKERIEECDVRVEKILSLQNNESNIITGSPFFLHWSSENTNNSRSIYTDSEVFCDVVLTIKDSDRLYIHHKQKHSGAGIPSWLMPGRYIFKIKVLGANIQPVEKDIQIEFDGNWDNLRMKLN
ncbi:hypothetical protein KJ652_05250 [Patescibacteria group bacterium]|nr:hypothetical protein [Patescibacteria group bacterium]